MNTAKKLLNFLLLNILWVICSVPIITIGAATCAAFSVSLKMAADEDVQVFKMFFKAFKQDFLQGIMMLFITAPCVAFSYFMWHYIIKTEKGIIFILGAFIVTVIFIIFNFYSYPLIARYSNTLKNVLRNSAGITVQYFKKTMITILIVAVEIAIMFIDPLVRFLGLFFVPELVIYTISKTAKPIFQKIEEGPAPSEENDDSETDDTAEDYSDEDSDDEITEDTEDETEEDSEEEDE